MRSFFLRIAVTILIVGWACVAKAVDPPVAVKRALPHLKVSDNRRFLVTERDQAFFWLGDTAWELFHRLTREEAEQYLARRAAQGFTVIQAVLLAELDGLEVPNAYGHLPLKNKDPAQPVEAYFEHVDWIVAKANALGLYVGMLPTWGSYWHSKRVVFNPENAEVYGRWLGQRYRDAGVVWILGGDRLVETRQHRRILKSMARGLREGDAGQHLITFHPRGGRSSTESFPDAEWLDFHMLQSGHSATSLNYLAIEHDYSVQPTKPCLDGEPSYEYPPDALPEKRPVGAVQVRRNAYWAVLAGALGHTYGTHPVWQMYAPSRAPLWDVVTPWHEALDLPGARQLRILKELIGSRPGLARIPDQSLVLEGQGEGIGRVQAARDGTPGRDDASYLMIYLPDRRRVTIQTQRLAAREFRGWWYDPTTGESLALGILDRQASHSFEPPMRSDGSDWVLVLDDASRNYPPPGVLLSQPPLSR
jgi:hypothetical protein